MSDNENDQIIEDQDTEMIDASAETKTEPVDDEISENLDKIKDSEMRNNGQETPNIEKSPENNSQISLIDAVAKSEPQTAERAENSADIVKNSTENNTENNQTDLTIIESQKISEINEDPVFDRIIKEDEIREFISFKVIEKNCYFKFRLNVPDENKKSDRAWASFENIKAERKMVRWLTKSGLGREYLRSNLTDEEKNEFEKKLDAETEENMSALVFDNTGSPRFLEEILGVTKQLGFVEFIVRFKYSRQERLIDGKNLKSRVPQMVIAYYEQHISFGKEFQQHYIVDGIIVDC